MPQKPQTAADLFHFYYQIVKPLYAEVQTSNRMPVEMLFELNAAFDHLSRKWQYDEPEAQAVDKAYSHLKRACLDAFKLKVKEVRDEYDSLRGVDVSIIDNGAFERDMIALFQRIRANATKARIAEGHTTKDEDDGEVHAFDLWLPVYDDCLRFEKDFFGNPAVEWARTKQRRRGWRERLDRLWVGVAGGLLVAGALALIRAWIAKSGR